MELCRLQSFPTGLEFDFSRNEIQRLLGNAVPSLLAEVMAWAIRRQLLGTRQMPSRMKLLPPTKKSVPPPEQVGRVPKKYMSLIGDHSDHPGEGLGNSARQRITVAA
jgi:DNA (cytosine-5)-methyltransferase 1